MHWIFLRGLGREARHWGDFPPQFAKAVNTKNITLQDLPGNGVFHAQRSCTSVGGMVDFARLQLTLAQIKPPYCVLAMSLGAMVATEWAALYPQEVERLVLINTSIRPHSKAVERLRPGSWAALAAVALRWRDGSLAERCIFNLTCRRIDTRQQDEAEWKKIRATAPVSRTNVYRQLSAAAQFQVSPQAPQCPTLVMSARADALVNPICSQRLANAWQAAHYQHDWAGHDLPHDDADWVCERVRSWVELDGPL